MQSSLNQPFAGVAVGQPGDGLSGIQSGSFQPVQPDGGQQQTFTCCPLWASLMNQQLQLGQAMIEMLQMDPWYASAKFQNLDF